MCTHCTLKLLLHKQMCTSVTYKRVFNTCFHENSVLDPVQSKLKLLQCLSLLICSNMLNMTRWICITCSCCIMPLDHWMLSMEFELFLVQFVLNCRASFVSNKYLGHFIPMQQECVCSNSMHEI
jgi:hypothetical protein